MTKDINFVNQTKALIDNLKAVCANYGLGNDGNEFKIITQVFLFKFMNDKFRFEARKHNKQLAKAENFQKAIENLSGDEYNFLLKRIGPSVPKLYPHEMISNLYNKQNKNDFAVLFDGTLRSISINNTEIFSVKSASGAKDKMFDELSQFISDASQRDAFCKALINKLFEFSFENMHTNT